ncbi:c-type cytochrome biogenesis protein CcmI [Phenylobacterium sp.]|jgi:cytochrome c-type biogenesis protein CcmH|uniref:c-type cytochrome biogenesis protein CcmI n=1 Tax=Phenylobacterium sp. TaxID=1871053 RepID=UPI002E328BDE|nr:c-type cytochrome biogenesis protein CcmI [Phenylobacterium sp.]HEX3367328.1 c-type cytochrome biogenesis protein CcmI [Phenylobacterium sp.]
MLWMILTLMVALAAVGLAIPLIRRHDAARTARGSVAEVLKGQIGEIEAQAAAGALPAHEAEALKADVKRRVLAEGKEPDAPARPLSERTLLILALGLVAVVVLAATGLYLKIGQPNATGSQPPATAASGALPPGHPNGEVASMIGQLEQRMKASPNDAEGWRMLGWSYLQVGRNADAATAYGRAVALDPHNGEYLSAQGEATVLAAQGQVTPAAEGIFRKAVSLDASDPRARYYLAIAKDQKGDAKGAMDDWIALLKSAPPDAPWAPEVRSFVEKVAQERHIDLTGRLPPAPAATASADAGPPSPAPGPTSDQVAAAGQMSAEGRQAMIEGMVAKQAAALKANPRDLDGWQRLIRARMVLGQPQAAAQAYRDAAKAFAGSPADQAALRQTAAGLGVPGV